MLPELDDARRQLHLRGSTGVFTHASDPRFSWCLHVPPPRPDERQPGLLVAVHHSLRNFIACRDGFAAFGARHHLVVLAPLFPIGVRGDGNPDGYKYLAEDGLRYDLLLNAMVSEVAGLIGCESERFLLYGYSGGGHFAHRYLMLHPQRVRAACVGAPGQVTQLDPDLDWWVGVRNVEVLFGHPLDLAALRRVPLQLVVGELDTDTDELAHAPGSRYWRADAGRAGANRIERLRSLQASFETAGMGVEFTLMPGVRHGDGSAPAMALAQRHFERHLVTDGA